MKYQLLSELLPLLSEFEKSQPTQVSVKHFTRWLQEKQDRHEEINPEKGLEPVIARLMDFNSRYLRSYVRKALDGYTITTLDEYSYLYTLESKGRMSKSDLIMHNRHEKSTGMEIIKRLIGLRLIAQAEDPADKRSKILSLTAEGLKEVGQSYARVNIAYHLITGNLSDTDKMALNRLLGRLELYHQVLAAKTRNESFEVIVKSALSR